MLESLISLAKQKRMCQEFYQPLSKAKNIDAAIPLYLANPTWALKENFPSLTFIKRYLSKKQEQGIYVDYEFNNELLNEHQVYIFHNCKGKVRVELNLEKQLIPMIYLANGSKIEISHDINIKVPIYEY